MPITEQLLQQQNPQQPGLESKLQLHRLQKADKACVWQHGKDNMNTFWRLNEGTPCPICQVLMETEPWIVRFERNMGQNDGWVRFQRTPNMSEEHIRYSSEFDVEGNVLAELSSTPLV